MSGIAAVVRRQVEQVLAARLPAALSPRIHTERERVPTGVAALDAMLAGGVPVGALTELVGPECSGRTSAALGVVAGLTQAGKVCAWVDVADALDPEAAAAAGVDLSRLLWVRCGAKPSAQPAESASRVEVRSALLEEIADAGRPVGPGSCGGGSQHPRNEVRGVAEALEGVLSEQPRSHMLKPLRRKSGIGTPGMPNRPVSETGTNSRVFAPVPKFQKGVSSRARSVARHEAQKPLAPAAGSRQREEQVAFDRLPPRRGSNLRLPSAAPRYAEHETRITAAARRLAPERSRSGAMRDGGALDQALRAADLLLMNGGFSAIVLDLGSTPAQWAWRIPLATWFRYRAACERGRTSLLLLTQHGCAKSSAEAVVRLAPGGFENEGLVMTGVRYEAVLERRRFERDDECAGPAATAAKVVSIRSAAHLRNGDRCMQPDGEANGVERPRPPQSVRSGGWSRAMSWVRGTR